MKIQPVGKTRNDVLKQVKAFVIGEHISQRSELLGQPVYSIPQIDSDLIDKLTIANNDSVAVVLHIDPVTSTFQLLPVSYADEDARWPTPGQAMDVPEDIEISSLIPLAEEMARKEQKKLLVPAHPVPPPESSV